MYSNQLGDRSKLMKKGLHGNNVQSSLGKGNVFGFSSGEHNFRLQFGRPQKGT